MVWLLWLFALFDSRCCSGHCSPGEGPFWFHFWFHFWFPLWFHFWFHHASHQPRPFDPFDPFDPSHLGCGGPRCSSTPLLSATDCSSTIPTTPGSFSTRTFLGWPFWPFWLFLLPSTPILFFCARNTSVPIAPPWARSPADVLQRARPWSIWGQTISISIAFVLDSTLPKTILVFPLQCLPQCLPQCPPPPRPATTRGRRRAWRSWNV